MFAQVFSQHQMRPHQKLPTARRRHHVAVVQAFGSLAPKAKKIKKHAEEKEAEAPFHGGWRCESARRHAVHTPLHCLVWAKKTGESSATVNGFCSCFPLMCETTPGYSEEFSLPIWFAYPAQYSAALIKGQRGVHQYTSTAALHAENVCARSGEGTRIWDLASNESLLNHEQWYCLINQEISKW